MYEFGVVMRVLAGRLRVKASAGPFINDNVFEMNFDVIGSDVHLDRGAVGPLVFPDAVGDYHHYRFVSGYNYQFAYAFFDGVYVGTYAYDSFGSAQDAYVEFGTDDDLPGRARFHFVWFDFLQDSELGEVYCGPAQPNSTGSPGTISAYGLPLIGQNSVELRGADLPAGQFSYFLASQDQGFLPVGQGNLCLAGAIGRFNLPSQVQLIPASGEIALPLDLTQIPTPMGTVPMTSGQTWNFQCWYRDSNPQPTSNLTDAVALALPSL